MKTLYLCFLLACVPVHAATDVVAHDDWEQLNRQVEARRIELAGLIKEAKQKGIVTDYASVSEQVIQVFQGAARHDRSNVDRVRRIFQTFSYYAKTDPTEADQLPFKELQACLEVADHALAELRQQLNGTVTLTGSPDFSKGSMALGAGYYRLEGNIVFPSSLVWMPKEERFMQAFGRLGEAYYQLGHLQESGTVNGGVFQRAMDSLESQCQRNAAPLVYFMGHAAAGWMKQDHPEILQGARHFTQYDIDSPLIRTWIEQLCAGVLPGLSEIGSTRPQMHLLANEPHFSTMKGGWRANNGLSAFSLQKYRQWLTAKYRTVDAVNEAYGTTYASLDRVTVDLPIDPALRGGAFWYDWCRFNMDRVNNWFTFLKRQVQANDRHASPVTIKMLGFTLSTLQRDHGLDIEYLTKLRPFVIYYCEEAAIQDEQYTSGFKDIYEALKLLNLPVGFTTPSEIGGLDAKKQILVVSPTRFIADNSLTKIKVFQRSGGRVVLFDAEQCFLKDEMGLPRSNDGIKDPFVTLPLKGVTQMTARLDAALNLAKSAMPMEIVITDLHGKKAYGVMISQIKDPKTGKPILLLNNVSKGRRVVILKPNGKSISRIVDVLTRQSVQTKLTLEPCDVRMLMNTD